MNKSLIINGLIQFGYNTDTLKACYYLRNEYKITYICFDEGIPKINMEGVDIIYVKHKNRLLRKIRLLYQIVKIAYQKKDVVILTSYFRFCSLLPISLPFKKCIIYFRSGSVSPIIFKNRFKNINMWMESFFFKNIATLTEDLKKHLNLPARTKILPLGADPISDTNKSFDELNLLYVGTLNGRHIHQTIYGVAEFKKNHPEFPIKYYIFGKGDNKKIKREINKYSLENDVSLLGFVPHNDNIKYYDNCNLGICYAPVTKYYINQPFTKLYEYCMSGMPVISVKLLDSVRRVNKVNGVLCDDNAQSFSDAIEQIYINRKIYISEQIRKSVKEFSWENISKNIFKKIIDG